MAAVDVGVDRDVLADPETVYPVAEGVDGPDELVARYERELGEKLAFVNMEVGTADPRLGDADTYLACLDAGRGDLFDCEVARCVINDGFHGDLLVVQL
jgi:hypothetical protein